MTPSANLEGDVTVAVAADIATDAAGNPNTAATDNVQAVDLKAPTAPTAVTLTPVGGTVVANTINSTNTHLEIGATITAGQATGGKAEFYVGATKVGEDTSIAIGDTSVTFTTSDGTPLNSELQTAIAAGGEVSVKLFDAAGNNVTSSVANPTLVRDVVKPTFTATPLSATDGGNALTINLTEDVDLKSGLVIGTDFKLFVDFGSGFTDVSSEVANLTEINGVLTATLKDAAGFFPGNDVIDVEFSADAFADLAGNQVGLVGINDAPASFTIAVVGP